MNIDLMFGLPAQTPEQAVDDLRTAIALRPTHLSWYQLTLEPNTAFHARPPPLPDDEQTWRMQTAGQALLAERGYTQYEVSAYAQGGQICRHNRNYWRFGDYLGIGAGAHGKITDSAVGRIVRRWKKRHPLDYLAAAKDGSWLDGQRQLDADDTVFEFALNRLRLCEGFTLANFGEVCGLPAWRLHARLEQAVGDGLLKEVKGRFCHTPDGWRFLDNLTARFLAEKEDRHARGGTD